VGSQPELELYENSFDFGTVHEGQRISHIFRLKNQSNKPVSITKTTTSCGCTIANSSAIEIPAGGDGDVEVILDTAGKSGKTSAAVSVILSDSSVIDLSLWDCL